MAIDNRYRHRPHGGPAPAKTAFPCGVHGWRGLQNTKSWPVILRCVTQKGAKLQLYLVNPTNVFFSCFCVTFCLVTTSYWVVLRWAETEMTQKQKMKILVRPPVTWPGMQWRQLQQNERWKSSGDRRDWAHYHVLNVLLTSFWQRPWDTWYH